MPWEVQEWMISTTTGVDDEVIPGIDTQEVDDDVPDTANNSDKAEIEPTNVKRMSGAKHLRRKPRK